jgi:hypothetical protein
MKHPMPAPKPHSVPSTQNLAGTVVHCHSGVNMTLNHFCLILQETPKTVLLAELSTGWKNDNPREGYERPLLHDHGVAAKALVEIFRVVQPGTGSSSQTTLIALLRMDSKYFDPHEVNQAFWLDHIHKRQVADDSVIVRVFRATKVTAEDGSMVFRHRHLKFAVWDGKAKPYDHND